MLARIVLLTAFASLVPIPNADAHGSLKQPKPTFDGSSAEWVTLIDNCWDIGSGGDQSGKFKTMAKEKGMSIKDVILDMVKDKKCGYTVADAPPQPIPSDGMVKWAGNGGGGFTHRGPCEIYIDDKMVLHGDDCEEEFPGGSDGSDKTSDMPVDFSSCNGNCMLTIYWLGFQNEQWQSYVNCVPLSGSGGSTAQTEGSQTTTQESLAKNEDGDNKTPSTAQSSNQTASPDEKTSDAPSSEQQNNQSPSSDPTPQPTPKQNQENQQNQQNQENKNNQQNQQNQDNHHTQDNQLDNKDNQQDQQNQDNKDNNENKHDQQDRQNQQNHDNKDSQQDQQNQQNEDNKDSQADNNGNQQDNTDNQQDNKKNQQDQQNKDNKDNKDNQQDRQQQNQDNKDRQQDQQIQENKDNQQDQQNQQNSAPRSLDFNNLSGGTSTGIVKPPLNL